MLLRQKDPIVDRLVAAGVRPRDARRLSLAGTPLTVPEGTALCTEGELGSQAFVLVGGDAVVRLDEGDRALEIGEVFGERAALDPQVRRNATVETTGAATVLVYDPRTFRALAVEMKHLLPRRAA